jgi:glutaredoxin
MRVTPAEAFEGGSALPDFPAPDFPAPDFPAPASSAPESTHAVTVMTRAECPGCTAAVEDVRRICTELGVPWSAEDVDSDSELRAEFGDRVPVILLDGAEHGFWQVEESRLRAALAK